LRAVCAAGVTIEANLTSNLRTGAVASYAKHPIRAWFDAGAKVTVSTDDPGVFGVDLTHEYRVLARELGFAPRQLVQLSRAGIESLFLSAKAKRALTAEFDKRAAHALALL